MRGAASSPQHALPPPPSPPRLAQLIRGAAHESDDATRAASLRQLMERERQPSFLVALCELAARPPEPPSMPGGVQLRLLAIISVKNALRRALRDWGSASNHDELEASRARLLSLLPELAGLPAELAQLSTTLALAARADGFRWPQLAAVLAEGLAPAQPPGVQWAAATVMEECAELLPLATSASDDRSAWRGFARLLIAPALHSFVAAAQGALGSLERGARDADVVGQTAVAAKSAAVVATLACRLGEDDAARPLLADAMGALVQCVRSALPLLEQRVARLAAGAWLDPEEPPLKLAVASSNALVQALAADLFIAPSVLKPCVDAYCRIVVRSFSGSAGGADGTPHARGELVFETLTLSALRGLITLASAASASDASARVITSLLPSAALQQLCAALLNEHFLLGAREREAWESAPEELPTADTLLHVSESVRAAARDLFYRLVRTAGPEALPWLAEVAVQSLLRAPPLAAPASTEGLSAGEWRLQLRKEAHYFAVGSVAYEMGRALREVAHTDFGAVFERTLRIEVASTHPQLRFLRRRVLWLLGEIASVDLLPARCRPEAHERVVHALERDGDLVVRLEAAETLRKLVDEFDYGEGPQLRAGFAEHFLRRAVDALVRLAHQVTLLETRRRIIGAHFASVVCSVGALAAPHAQHIAGAAGALWDLAAREPIAANAVELHSALCAALASLLKALGPASEAAQPACTRVVALALERVAGGVGAGLLEPALGLAEALVAWAPAPSAELRAFVAVLLGRAAPLALQGTASARLKFADLVRSVALLTGEPAATAWGNGDGEEGGGGGGGGGESAGDAGDGFWQQHAQALAQWAAEAVAVLDGDGSTDAFDALRRLTQIADIAASQTGSAQLVLRVFAPLLQLHLRHLSAPSVQEGELALSAHAKSGAVQLTLLLARLLARDARGAAHFVGPVLLPRLAHMMLHLLVSPSLSPHQRSLLCLALLETLPAVASALGDRAPSALESLLPPLLSACSAADFHQRRRRAALEGSAPPGLGERSERGRLALLERRDAESLLTADVAHAVARGLGSLAQTIGADSLRALLARVAPEVRAALRV